MNIGVIGAGEMGGTLAKHYTRAGHTVKIANRHDVEKLERLALETGAIVTSSAEVVKEVDVLVICVPMKNIPELARHLSGQISSKIIIVDTGNYYPIRDGRIEEIENGLPESVWVSNQLQMPVIKTYNTILYRSLLYSGVNSREARRVALPISGDDKNAKMVVSGLMNDSGFDSWDIGTLQDSWRQQPGSPVYCTDLTLSELKKSVVTARRELLPGRRELGLKYILTHSPQEWKENVEHNREIYESCIDKPAR